MTEGTNCVPVTRSRLWTPLFSRSEKISARRFTEISYPLASWLISWFWQKTQPSVQPEKKTAPVPFPSVPEMHGSSHRCGAALAIRTSARTLQNPVCFDRSTPHSLGQRRQLLYCSNVLIAEPSFPAGPDHAAKEVRTGPGTKNSGPTRATRHTGSRATSFFRFSLFCIYSHTAFHSARASCEKEIWNEVKNG